MNTILPTLVACLALAQPPTLTGIWYHRNAKCAIGPDFAINEKGERTQAELGVTQIAAWGMRGHLIRPAYLLWENSTMWSRTAAPITLTFLHKNIAPVTILYNGEGLPVEAVNEEGRKTALKASADKIVAVDWDNLTATFNGQDIRWSNGDWWRLQPEGAVGALARLEGEPTRDRKNTNIFVRNLADRAVVVLIRYRSIEVPGGKEYTGTEQRVLRAGQRDLLGPTVVLGDRFAPGRERRTTYSIEAVQYVP